MVPDWTEKGWPDNLASMPRKEYTHGQATASTKNRK